MTLATIPTYILAGGRSTRFGSDKARAVLCGRTLIEHVAELLRPFSSRLTAVADRPDKLADLGLRTIADRRPGAGPLAGLEAALLDLAEGEDWLLLASCDAVGLKAGWIEALLLADRTSGRAAAFHDGLFWQPIPGLYSRRLLIELGERLGGENRSLRGLLDAAGAVRVAVPADWSDRWQANTPADLDRL